MRCMPSAQHARIKQHFPARSRRRIAGLDRIQIRRTSPECQASIPLAVLDRQFKCEPPEMPAGREPRRRFRLPDAQPFGISRAPTGWRAAFFRRFLPTRPLLLPFIADRLRRAVGRRRARHGVRPDFEHAADQHGRAAGRRLGRRAHRRDVHHRGVGDQPCRPPQRRLAAVLPDRHPGRDRRRARRLCPDPKSTPRPPSRSSSPI